MVRGTIAEGRLALGSVGRSIGSTRSGRKRLIREENAYWTVLLSAGVGFYTSLVVLCGNESFWHIFGSSKGEVVLVEVLSALRLSPFYQHLRDS